MNLHTLPNKDFDDIIARVNALGKGVVSDYAPEVDRDARFPHEAFAAFKAEKLLSAYIPSACGGMGLNITQICKLCEILGQYCASTAMIYAMHQIQVACMVHHAQTADYFREYLCALVEKQYLLASATTELGIGGDLRSSLCAVETEGERYRLEKKAPVISYGEAADAILVTCRRAPDAASNDQSFVLVLKSDCHLQPIAGWDTLGFRATCSSGFVLNAEGARQQIFPVPYAEILTETMHPVSHLVWGSLWTGLAASAVKIARAEVRNAARKNPDTPPVSALRLSEVDELLFGMRGSLYQAIAEYQQLRTQNKPDSFSNFGFTLRINNVKILCSEMVVDIVGKALMIVGISGYKNDSGNSLCRHIRDAYGAALMVNNDRIRNHNAMLQIAYKDT